MKKFLCSLVLGLISILLFMCLCGCTVEKPIIVSTNKYIQTDYDYNCLSNDKTFSEIILCYEKQDKAEKAQNKLTNDMIKQENTVK